MKGSRTFTIFLPYGGSGSAPLRLVPVTLYPETQAQLQEILRRKNTRTGYEVFQRFAELPKGKSAVLISRCFFTVRMADRILAPGKGELMLKEQGLLPQLEWEKESADCFSVEAAFFQLDKTTEDFYAGRR